MGIRFSVLALLMGLALLTALASGAEAKPKKPAPAPTPVIFVHGSSGSAQQFETNAMRLTSNGFPQNRIFAFEYSTAIPTNDHALSGLDSFIDKVESKTGAKQVDVLAHSRGTSVMHTFLSTPERAAQVRRYVNFDGRTAESLPGGVSTLAIWGEGPPEREIVGAVNIAYPEKSHTEVTTSRQAFGDLYRFLLDKEPKTLNVVPEPPTKVSVVGRALNFPDNTGIEGRRFDAYVVDAKTGRRTSRRPIYTKVIGPQGNFGPIKVNGRMRYEFVITGKDESGEDALTIHNYPEAFERDDHFYRVLSAPALAPFLDEGPNHTNVAVTRMREFRGDQVGPGSNDRLMLNGQNVISPAIAPRDRRVLAVFNLDRGADGITDLSAPLTPFSLVSFLTGTDIFIPASPGGGKKIAVTERMREPGGQTKTTNVRNWPASKHTVSVFFKDYAAKSYPKQRRKKKG